MCTAPLTGVAMITIMYQPLCIPSNRPKVLIYLRSKTGIIVEKSNGNLALPKDEKKRREQQALDAPYLLRLGLALDLLALRKSVHTPGKPLELLGPQKIFGKAHIGRTSDQPVVAN